MDGDMGVLEAAQAPVGQGCKVMDTLTSRLGDTPHLELSYEASIRTLWITMAPRPHPRLTPEMMDSFLRLSKVIREEWGRQYPDGAQPIRFAVLRSERPDVFSSGGDLSSILGSLEAGDMDGVRRYFQNGTRSVHAFLDGFGASIVTIASVSGMTYGGGFECARACEYIVADPTARFAFPEWRFGLFPGNGAFGVVGARHGERLLKRLVLGGEQLTGEEALEAGVVDKLAPEGGVEAATRELIAWLTPRHAACLALRRGMQALNGPSHEALTAETERYLAVVAQADVGSMRRLVALQDRAFSRRR